MSAGPIEVERLRAERDALSAKLAESEAVNAVLRELVSHHSYMIDCCEGQPGQTGEHADDCIVIASDAGKALLTRLAAAERVA